MPNNLLIPAYFDPTSDSQDWANITQLSDSGLNVTAIINPNSGPAASVDSAYTNAINSAIDAGAHIVAYVDTANGTRDIDLVKADIDTYLSQYPQISGFFLDQMSNKAEDVAYYQTLHDYIKGLSTSYTVIGNPGTATVEAYTDTADVLVTFEGSASDYQSYTPENWMADYNADRFANLVYNTATLNEALAADQHAIAIGVGYSYITNDTFDTLNPSTTNPWDSLSTYYLQQTLSGNTTNNLLSGQLGNDSLAGLAGNDTLNGNPSADTLDGGDGNDSLSGGTGDDRLLGGLGNDSLNGGSGSDKMDGGKGNDVYLVDDTSDIAAESFNLAQAGGIDTVKSSASHFTLGNNIDNLILTDGTADGGTGNFNGQGNEINNTLTGNAGNNELLGMAGNDSLVGGAGNDTLEGGTGADTLVGGLGSDIYKVNLIQSGTTLKLEDTITEGVDKSLGNDDTILLQNIIVLNTASTITLGDNIESLSAAETGLSLLNLTGNALDNLIQGNNANNKILGLTGNDSLIGEQGDDTLDGGTGNDTLIGGQGADTYFVSSTNDSVIEQTDEGVDTVFIGITDSTQYKLTDHVENGQLTNTITFTLSGNDRNNLLIGNSAKNFIYDDVGGDDTLNGGAGADDMIGGDGNDVYVVDNIGDSIVEAQNQGKDTIQSSITFSLAIDDYQFIENLTLTGSANLSAMGNASNNQLIGNAGNNTLDGDTGVDTMSGGNGNDLYVVDSIGDEVIESSDSKLGGIDTVRSSIDFVLNANSFLENLTLTGTAVSGLGNELNNTIIGNANDNSLSGNVGNDSLSGFAGNDTLNGGLDNDTLVGGDGNDTYIVDNIKDSVIETNKVTNTVSNTDTVQSSVTYTLGANLENLTLTDSTNINGTGNTLNNLMLGNTSDNILDGAAGIDTLQGGAGNDTYLVDLVSSTSGTKTTLALQDILEDTNGSDTLKLRLVTQLTPTFTIELTDNSQSQLANQLNADLSAFEHLDISGTGTNKFNLIGNASNNLLIGNAAVNTIMGGSGDDTLDGGSSADHLFGGAGSDTYVVDSLNDKVYETATSDISDIADLGGIDTIQAKISYSLATQPLIENLTLLALSTALNATGNNNQNILTGNDFANSLIGGADNDTLIGNAGDDTLNGGTGDDSLVGGAGNDTYVIDSDLDVINETGSGTLGGTDTVQSSISFDLSTQGINIEHLTLTGTTDILATGNAFKNRLTGNDGNNTLDGGLGEDTLSGGKGNDLYIVDLKVTGVDGKTTFAVAGLQDTISESTLSSGGIDTLLLRSTANLTKVSTLVLADSLENLDAHLTGNTLLNLTGNNVANTIVGNDSANLLLGGLGNDSLAGGIGNDTLDGGSGLDTLAGGDDNDTYLTDLTSQGTGNSTTIGTLDSISDSQGNDTVILRGNITLPLANTKTIDLSSDWSGIENIKADLTGTTRLNLLGNADANLLVGNAADNLIDGQSGDDTLVGGAGNDTYVVDSLGDIVTELTTGSTDTIQANIDYDLQDTDGAGSNGGNIENLVLLGTNNLQGTGNQLNNKLTGNSGNNLLLGLAGKDTLDGGTGSDTLDGGAGNDVYLVNDINTLVQESDSNLATGGIDLVTSSVDYTITNSAIENLTLIGAAITAIGNASNNTLTGNVLNNLLNGDAGNDSLIGGLGNDTLDGGIGLDTLSGGDGNDTYIVNDPKDVIVESNPNGGTDTVQASVSFSLLAQANLNLENLVLLGTDNLNAGGNDRNNTLTGNSGNNQLNGGGGNDTMVGDDGNDTYFVNTTGDQVTETNSDNASGGVDTVNATISYTLGSNLENLNLLGTANLNGTGNTLDNLLTGNNGNNSLSGGDGNDTLNGGTGADTMVGGQGDDRYTVDNASDLIKENSGEGTDSITTSVSYNLSTKAMQVENITAAAGKAIINLTGNALANQITGNDANNSINGGLGNDTIDGGEGTDTVILSGTKNDYDITFNNGVYTVTGKDGMDILSNIEKIQFGTSKAVDISSTLAADTVPTTALAALNSGLKWDTTTITYSFMTSKPTYDNVLETGTPHDQFKEMSDAEKEMVREVLALYSQITGLIFKPVEDANDSSVMLRYGTENSHDTNLLGYAYNPEPTSDNTLNSTNLGGDVWLNRKSIYSDPNSQYFSESQTFLTLLHETGHALGLKHPFEGSDTLPLSEQNHAYTVMAYDAAPKTELYKAGDRSLSNIDTVTPMTPMLYDVAIMQSLYGSNNTYNSEDTVYAFNQSQPILETLWDSGGNDTIDTSTFTRKSIIDLREGHYSSIGIGKHLGYDAANNFVELPLIGFSANDLANSIESNGYDGTNNLAIAYGAVIENALGGSNDDIIRGNLVSNRLEGGNGNDNLYGYAGEDTLLGDAGNDTVMAGDGLDTVIGGEGNDELHGGLGNDTLEGDFGQDTFVFDTFVGNDNIDTLIDFDAGVDKIVLDHSIFTDLGGSGALNSGSFILGNASTSAAHQIIYDQSTGVIYYNDGSITLAFATLINDANLSSSDFVIV